MVARLNNDCLVSHITAKTTVEKGFEGLAYVVADLKNLDRPELVPFEGLFGFIDRGEVILCSNAAQFMLQEVVFVVKLVDLL